MTGTSTRSRVTFASGGTECAGYLYRPAGEIGVAPCVVLATGFSGTQDTPSIIATAEAFAYSGLAALTFDYRNFGESGGKPRQVIHIKDQLEDLHAAVSFARSQEGIDPNRMALWGSSLGGGHVVAAAADDPRIAAVVAQVPFNGFPKKIEGRASKATRALLCAMIKDAVRGALGRPPFYIRAVGEVGELAVMASPQAKKTIEVLTSGTWRNEVAPRVLFEMMKYKPGDKVHLLQMPLLVCIAEFDRETQGDVTVQLAHNAPRGELKSYPVAHFDFYRPDIREQVLVDQVEFLREHLLA